MCVLSIVPQSGFLIVTSNRDEQRTRENSMLPAFVNLGERKTIIVKDSKAQGTWILTDHTRRTAVLLNGAFENHIPTPPYRESRGITLMNLFQEQDFKKAFELYNLESIEPFQIIFIEHKVGYHFLWDGLNKHLLSIDLNKPHVFFSATLYTKKQQEVKRNNFFSALNKHPKCTATWLLNFHSNQANISSDVNFFMNREKHTTKSITQIQLNSKQSFYKHWQIWDDQRLEYTLDHVTFS
jgi:hypothetical protein